ncbi:MAG: S-layer homology domain-containing protein [Firmicutes bacterium]|nr:S-layer homology domain-containing protein [Bacillota bacterium]
MKAKLTLSAVIALALAAGIGTSSVFAAYNSRYFIDVNEGSYAWATDAIDSLFEGGVVKGVGDNKFAPERYIERGDFAVLLNNTFKFQPFNTYSIGYSDVSEDSYYHTAIVNAAGNGIIEDRYAYYPEMPITRGAAMGMLYRALDNAGFVKSSTTDLSMYSDAGKVSDIKSQIALGTLTQMGIISGNGGQIKYSDYMARAEMAMVFYKTIEYMNTNPVSVDKTKNTVTKDYTKPSTKTETSAEATTEDTAESSNKSGTLKDQTLKSTIIINGVEYSGVDHCVIRNNENSQASLVVSNKFSADITDSEVHATGNSSNAVDVYSGAGADIDNTSIYAGGERTNGIRGAANSTVTVAESQFTAKGKKTSAIRTAGEAEVTDSSFAITNGAAVTAEDAAEVTIENSVITAESISDGLFCSIVGAEDNPNDTSKIKVKNCDITGDRKTVLFFANNNDLRATLEHCTVSRVAQLVNSSSDIAPKDKEGCTIKIDLVDQELEADCICDNKSKIVINLKNGSHLTTSINEINLSDYVEVNVEDGCTLELTTDCYIDVLKYEDAQDIHENGRTIYYDADDSKNDWLFDSDYSLSYGGQLSPQ